MHPIEQNGNGNAPVSILWNREKGFQIVACIAKIPVKEAGRGTNNAPMGQIVVRLPDIQNVEQICHKCVLFLGNRGIPLL